MKKALIVFTILFAFAAQAQQKTYSLGPATDCKIVAPNAFTPNDDGVNDLFFVSVTGECTIISFEIKIFDRWGRLVFEGNETTDEWDGTYDGRQLKEGVYLWQSTVTWASENESGKTTETKKGSLVLIR